MKDDNAYSPTTANEAGERVICPGCNEDVTGITPDQHTPCPGIPALTAVDITSRGQFSETKAEPYGVELPSKPCTEDGEHCFCVDFGAKKAKSCCWCDGIDGVVQRNSHQRVPGHGPYRTELIRE